MYHWAGTRFWAMLGQPTRTTPYSRREKAWFGSGITGITTAQTPMAAGARCACVYTCIYILYVCIYYMHIYIA